MHTRTHQGARADAHVRVKKKKDLRGDVVGVVQLAPIDRPLSKPVLPYARGGEGGESAREREKVREKDRERESGGLGEDAEDGSVGLGIFHVEEVTEVV